MMRIAMGLIVAALLAACTDLGSTTAPPAPGPQTSGVGHPAADYPGPRAY